MLDTKNLINAKNVTIINHPLIIDKLTRLRDKNTKKKAFQENLTELVILMGYEVFKALPLVDEVVVTPVATTIGKKLKKTIILCPILRAGLGMVSGLEKILPNAVISHIGIYRYELT